MDELIELLKSYSLPDPQASALAQMIYAAIVHPAVLAERERCAKLCDDISADRWKKFKHGNSFEGRADPFMEGQSHGADACADAIRG